MCDEYSKCICEAMMFLDKKIEQFNEGSVNQVRLHKRVNILLMTKIKDIIKLNNEERTKRINDVFLTELNNEIIRMRGKNHE